jgi:predicted nucleic acid-binding protein
VTVFIDTAVLMYANGTSHPLREPCRAIMIEVGDGRLEAVTSAEVVQEILHRFMSLRRPEIGIDIARVTMDAFAPVIPITHALMRRVPDLAARYPNLSARDLVHVATCIHEGITEILTPDRGFDQVAEIRRIDPADFAVDPA